MRFELMTTLYSITTEQTILSALLDNPNDIENIDPDLFYSDRHKTILNAMKSIFTKNQQVDILAVQAYLEDHKQLHQVGGDEYLNTIVNIVDFSGLASHLERLQRLAHCRKIEQAGLQIAKFSQDTTTENLDEKVQQIIAELETGNTIEEHSVGIKQAVINAFDVLQKRFDRLKDSTGLAYGVNTGLTLLDEIIGDIEPSHLCIIGASPSCGKSTLAQMIALNAMCKNNAPTIFFSLEMKAEDIACRLLSSMGNVNFKAIRTGNLQPDEWSAITNTSTKLSELPLKIVDKAGMTIAQVRSECRKMLKEHGKIGCIIIDYLQLLTDPSKKSRFDEVSQISRDLKSLAKDFNAPVIALSQLNRAGAKTKPTMQSLRESGQIEQDADQIIFIDRECVRNPDVKDDGMAELIIAKNRHGKTGSVRVVTDFEVCRFANLA